MNYTYALFNRPSDLRNPEPRPQSHSCRVRELGPRMSIGSTPLRDTLFTSLPQPQSLQQTSHTSENPCKLRQFNLLLSQSLTNYFRHLKNVIPDLEIQCPPLRLSPEQVLELKRNRNQIFRQGVDRVVKSMINKNAEVRRTVDQYRNSYSKRFGDPDEHLVTLGFEKHNSDYPQDFMSKCDLRPKTMNNNYNSCPAGPSYRFSRSVVIEKRLRSTTMSQFHSENSSVHDRDLANSSCITGIYRLSQTQKASNNPQYLQGGIQELLVSSRLRFVEDYKSNRFAPAVGKKRSLPLPVQHSHASSVMMSPEGKLVGTQQYQKRLILPNALVESKLDEMEIIKDKIRLLNCELAIKATKHQGYKKINRNPRNFSSIFV